MCKVYCVGKKSCQGAIITMPSDANAEVYCGGDGTEQCKGAQIIIPQPVTPHDPNIIYDFLCWADRACVDTTFEYAAFFYASDYVRNARLICRGDSCDDTTKTICPWEDIYPNECFSRSDLLTPTPAPSETTLNPTNGPTESASTTGIPSNEPTTTAEPTPEFVTTKGITSAPTTEPTADVTTTTLEPTKDPIDEYDILCTTEKPCTGPIVCEGTEFEGTQLRCRIICLGEGSCTGLDISCADAYDCDVSCYGKKACLRSTITLPTDYWGNVLCGEDGDDKESCLGTTVIIPPPATLPTSGHYSMFCRGEDSCVDASFGYAEFDYTGDIGQRRHATLTCYVGVDREDFACDNSTQRVCPWEEEFPDDCIEYREDSAVGTFAPTIEPTTKTPTLRPTYGSSIFCSEDSPCTNPVVCGGSGSCEVQCYGVNACINLNISCGDSYSCSIYCNGEGACQFADITLPADYSGSVYCGLDSDHNGACYATTVRIPPPEHMSSSEGFYEMECGGEVSCYEATFEFEAFDYTGDVGQRRPAKLTCAVGVEGDDFACNNSTKRICPWEKEFPNDCIDYEEDTVSNTFEPTLEPTLSPTAFNGTIIVCDDEGVNNCTSPIVCDEACSVICDGVGACSNFNISCEPQSMCNIGCFGNSSCENATITLPADDLGDVFCGNGNKDSGACRGAHIYIPPQTPFVPFPTREVNGKDIGGYYVFECLGRDACDETTFEFVDYNISLVGGSDRKAYLQCNVGMNGTTPWFACDNTTRTICPWEDKYPDACFTRTDVSSAPSMAPTKAPEKKEDNTGKIVGGVIGGLCGVGIIAIIVVLFVQSRKEEEPNNYDRVSGVDGDA